MARALLPVLLVLAVQAVVVPDAQATCSPVVVVDGYGLRGQPVAPEAARLLPAAGPARPAVSPACNDAGQDDPDGTTQVLPVRGLPATLAVTSPERRELYVADGSLLALAAHPLHRAYAFGLRARPRGSCRPAADLRGTLRRDAFAAELVVQAGATTRTVGVDERTRLVGQPPWLPLLRGQSVAMTTARCGDERVARSIELLNGIVRAPPLPERPPPGPSDTGDLATALVVGFGITLVVVVLLAAAWHTARPARRR